MSLLSSADGDTPPSSNSLGHRAVTRTTQALDTDSVLRHPVVLSCLVSSIAVVNVIIIILNMA